MSEHTPGPWRWEVNPKSRLVQLLSRNEKAVWGNTVLDFVRWGFSGAAPRFRNEKNLMQRADELMMVAPGREHHADWHRLLSHPDARLIEAAPGLLKVAEHALEVVEPRIWSSKADVNDLILLVACLKSEIAKAKGGTS